MMKNYTEETDHEEEEEDPWPRKNPQITRQKAESIKRVLGGIEKLHFGSNQPLSESVISLCMCNGNL